MGAGFEGGKGASDWTSVKLGSIWGQRVLRAGRLGHTGKWTACPCTAAHRGVTGAHGVSSRGRAGGSLTVLGGSVSCTVPLAAFPLGRLASSHSGSWQDRTPRDRGSGSSLLPAKGHPQVPETTVFLWSWPSPVRGGPSPALGPRPPLLPPRWFEGLCDDSVPPR